MKANKYKQLKQNIMKRFFFSSIALMVAMTACTESGLIDAPEFYGNPIVFDTYIGKTPVTKAENCNIEALKAAENNGGGARIYAFESDKEAQIPFSAVNYDSHYLNGKLLFANPSWGYYEGSSLVDAYMPVDKDLAVVAYSLNAGISTDESEFTFTVNNNVANQVDFLVTPLTLVTENVTGGDTKVPLRFYHLLSRVGFKVQSSNESEDEIVISSVKLMGSFPTTGNIDLTASTAKPSSSKPDETNIALQSKKPQITPNANGTTVAEYELLPGNDNVFQITAAACYTEPQQITPEEGGCYMMIMPGVQSAPSVQITYKVGNAAGEETVTINLADLNTGITYFEAGYAYEFLFKVSTSAIEFSAEIPTDWDETGADIPVTPTPNV